MKLSRIIATLLLGHLITLASPSFAQDELQIVDESLPLYGFLKMSNAVPTDSTQDVVAMSVGIGITHLPKEATGIGSNIALRLIWIPDAPANPLDKNALEIGSAWGPIFDWQVMMSPRRRVSVFTNVSFGFIYGKPEGEPTVETIGGSRVSDAERNKNQVLPILEGGLGLRVLSSKLGSSQLRLFVAPELGFVPGINAPYGAISIGLL
jgi:hypothetical protein